jgi:hypothetical protein
VHRVAVKPGKLCLTLFLETMAVGSTTRIFIDPGHVVRRTIVARQRLDSDGYRRRLEAILDELIA